VGLLIAVWSTNLLLSLMPPTGLPFSLNLSPDVRVLGFSLLLSLLTGSVFGLACPYRKIRISIFACIYRHSAESLFFDR
jgi:hypothetical protein